MFSHELFDFASTGHLSDAHLDAQDPYHDSLFDSYIDSSCVDQSFCSDFACCGQKLPDLHRLLEHFEEEHVLPLPSDARPLFSSPVYAQPRSAAFGPYTSYILSYPQPDPPLHAAAHSISVSQSPTSDPGSRALPTLQFDWTSPAAGAVPDLTHTPLSPSPTASSATSAHSSPGPSEPLCLPPALFSVQPSTGTGTLSRSRRDRTRARARATWSDADIDVDDTDEEEDESSDAPPARPAPPSKPSLSASGNTTGPHRRAKTKTKSSSAARMEPFAFASAARARPAERERERAPLSVSPASPKRRDGREKAFRCPHPGCTKSYLNPNGLKYHLEKGTCTNADARGRDPLPDPSPAVVPSCPAAPTTTTTPTTGSDSVPSAVVGEAGDASSVGAADVRA